MNLLKKLLLFLLVFTITSQSVYSKTAQKEIEVETKDGYTIKATLSYEKIKDKNKYPTIVLLHSLGYSSGNWGTLIPELNNAGYAVIAIDLRGHGKSVYNSKLQIKSWIYFTPKAYQKFPSDVIAILKQAQVQSKKVDFTNWGIVGADIGANTAILTAKEFPHKPKAMILISPSMNFKGLYVPIAMTEIGTMPILSMVSKQDDYSIQEQKKLSKFAQGAFYAQNYPKGGMGMMMLKANPSMTKDIVSWLKTVVK